MSDYWKKTAEMFQKLISKPKMTEKLLSKPPFKYIFDIIQQTSKKTGFGEGIPILSGLFSNQENNSEYYSDKDKKINYLNKIIEYTKNINKQEISAKPKQIVAGLQPENTNVMLQAIYKAATSKVNFSTLLKPKASSKQQLAKKEEPKKETKQKEVKKQSSKENAEAERQATMKHKARPPSPKGGKSQKPKQEFASFPKKIDSFQQKKQKPVFIEQKQQVKQKVKEDKPINQQNHGKLVLQAKGQDEVEIIVKEQQEKQTEENQEGGNKIEKKKKKKKDKNLTGNMVKAGQLDLKDIESIKNMVQLICQNATPLGKSVQYINDDLESMNQQFKIWRKEYNEAKEKMNHQLKITEETLIPLYDKLSEIEEKIKNKKDKIQAYKAQILRNQTTIKQLLVSVVTTK